MNKQIIFDMDGVIFDTEKLTLGCWCFVAEKYNIPHIKENYYRTIGISSEGTKDILHRVYGGEFPVETFLEECRRQYTGRVAKSGVPVKAGARELLSFLKINGYRIGLASSSRYETVKNNLSETGLFDFFEVIVSGDMVEKSKPEPEIYLRACEEMNIMPEAAFAVEDSYNGILSAARAGLRAILVPDLMEPNEEMEKAAFAVFDDLIDVRKYLAGNGI